MLRIETATSILVKLLITEYGLTESESRIIICEVADSLKKEGVIK